MELLDVLHLLWRRRLLVALGGVLSIVVALAALGKLPGVPAKPQASSGVALSQVLVDRPSSLVAGTPSDGDDTLQPRASLLVESMAGDVASAAIARGAGIQLDQLSIHTPSMLAIPVIYPIAQRASLAALAPRGREAYLVTLQSEPAVSTISILAYGPDRASAEKLADSTVHVLESTTAQDVRGGPSAVKIVSLGAPATMLVTAGKSKMIAVVAFVFFFAFWCTSIVILSGLIGVARDSAARAVAQPVA